MCGRYSLIAEIGELSVGISAGFLHLLLLWREYASGNLRTTALDASPLVRIPREADAAYHLPATASAAAYRGRPGALLRLKVEP